MKFNTAMKNMYKMKSIGFFTILGLYFVLSFISQLIYQIQVLFNLKYYLSIGYKICVILLITFLLFKELSNINTMLRNHQFILVLSFFCINLIASLISFKNYKIITIKGVLDSCVLVYNFVIFYVLMQTKQFNESNIKLLFQFFIFNICLAAFYNIVVNFSDIAKIFLSSTKSYAYNFSSFFSNRNTFSIYLSLGIVLYLFVLSWTQNRSIRIIKYGAIIFLLFNLIITLSRTSMMGLLICILIYFIFTKKISLKRKITIGAFGIFIVLLILTTPLGEFVKSKMLRKEIGNTGRTDIWLAAILLPNEFYEIMFGYGNGVNNMLLELKTGHSSFHNSFLKIYTSGGIILLSFYIIFITKVIISNIQNTKNREIKIKIFAFQIGHIVMSFFESNVLFSSTSSMQLTTLLVISLPVILQNTNQYVSKDILEKREWTKILLF